MLSTSRLDNHGTVPRDSVIIGSFIYLFLQGETGLHYVSLLSPSTPDEKVNNCSSLFDDGRLKISLKLSEKRPFLTPQNDQSEHFLKASEGHGV
jgi:hypothetical protein